MKYARQVAEAAVEFLLDSNEQVRHDAAMERFFFFTTWPTQLTGSLAKVSRQKAEQLNQELQEKLCQLFQSEASINYARDQDQMLRKNFPQVAKESSGRSAAT